MSLDPNALTVESFDTTPTAMSIAGVGQGTACFETCKTDYTSDPDRDTCGDKTNP
ncbi:MAG TPA: hypothetical protein VF665_20475 [Longimicrobium sp.]|jgi:hypothetical protein|uniref:hypothetical protein n=1 Tax=Longimicrobium sp. TaxID=2029185 RepID=UPI002EDA5F08